MSTQSDKNGSKGRSGSTSKASSKTSAARSTSSKASGKTSTRSSSSRTSSSKSSGKSSSGRSASSSRSSTAKKSTSAKKSSTSTKKSTSARPAAAPESSSSLRTGFTTLLVVAALAAVLYAIGVGRGAIDMDSDNQLASFSDFLLSGFGSEGETPEYVTPMSSTATTTSSTTQATTTTTKATTTTTKAATTTTKATTTTTKATTTTTKGTTTTTKGTTTTTKGTTTTTQTTTTTTPAPVVTTQATTAPTYANASYVVDPNYESPYYIVVYAGESQSVAVYSKDAGGCYSVLTKCFSCSTGAPESPTRTGQYRIRAKYRWRLLYGYVYGQYSSSISSSYLFHSVPYAKEKENTLDMAEYAKLGTAASHGCIRLCVRDSKWIYDNCPIGTQVNIVNKSGPKGGGVPSLNYDTIYKGWDPSDPHADNPYNN